MSELGDFFKEHWPDVKEPEQLSESLEKIYPSLDLLFEAEKAKLWEERCGTKKRNHSRFFTNWLRRAGASRQSSTQPHASGTSVTSDSILAEKARQTAEKQRQRTLQYIKQLESLTPSHEERKQGIEKCREILKKLQ